MAEFVDLGPLDSSFLQSERAPAGRELPKDTQGPAQLRDFGPLFSSPSTQGVTPRPEESGSRTFLTRLVGGARPSDFPPPDWMTPEQQEAARAYARQYEAEHPVRPFSSVLADGLRQAASGFSGIPSTLAELSSALSVPADKMGDPTVPAPLKFFTVLRKSLAKVNEIASGGAVKDPLKAMYEASDALRSATVGKNYSKLSLQRQAERLAAEERVRKAAESSGEVGAFFQAAKEGITDPEQMLDQVANLAVMGGLGRVAGFAGAIGGGAVLQAGDVTSDFRRAMEAAPEEAFAHSPDYEALLRQGVSPAEARRRVTDEYAQGVFAASGMLSVAANTMLPGGGALEHALAGNVSRVTLGSLLKAAVGESLSEAVEEGTGQIAANVGQIRTVAPGMDAYSGAGQAAGAGAALGLMMGGGSHSIAGLRHNLRATAQEQQQQAREEATDAIGAAGSVDEALTAFDRAVQPIGDENAADILPQATGTDIADLEAEANAAIEDYYNLAHERGVETPSVEAMLTMSERQLMSTLGPLPADTANELIDRLHAITDSLTDEDLRAAGGFAAVQALDFRKQRGVENAYARREQERQAQSAKEARRVAYESEAILDQTRDQTAEHATILSETSGFGAAPSMAAAFEAARPDRRAQVAAERRRLLMQRAQARTQAQVQASVLADNEAGQFSPNRQQTQDVLALEQASAPQETPVSQRGPGRINGRPATEISDTELQAMAEEATGQTRNAIAQELRVRGLSLPVPPEGAPQASEESAPPLAQGSQERTADAEAVQISLAMRPGVAQVQAAVFDDPTAAGVNPADATAARVIGRLFKKRLVWFQANQTESDGRVSRVQIGGFVRADDAGTIYLNTDGQESALSVVSHEVLHLLKREHGEAYRALREKVSADFAAHPDRFEAFKRYYNDASLTDEETLEEAIADALGNQARDPRFWANTFARVAMRQGQEKAQGTIRRLRDAIAKLIAEVVNVLKGEGGFENYITQLNEVSDALEEATASYLEAGRTGALRQAVESETRFSRSRGKENVEENRPQTPAAAGPARDGGPVRGVSAEPSVRPAYGEPRAGAVSVTGIHYSTAERSALHGYYYYGQGLKGEEAKRLADAPEALRNRIYFYVDVGAGIAPEPGVGNLAHEVQLNNIYDLSADPKGLLRTDLNALEMAVLAEGYDGYLVRTFARDLGAVVLLGPHSNVPVAPVGRGPLAADAGRKAPDMEIAPERRVADALRANKGLPAGEMPAARWGRMIEAVSPALYGEMAPTGVFDSQDPMYKDEIAAEYMRRVRRGPRMSSARQGPAVVFEVAPNPDDAKALKAWNDFPSDVRAKISAEVAGKVSAKLASRLKAGVGSTKLAPQSGGYENETSPSFGLTLSASSSGESVIELAKTIGYVLDQKSVAIVSRKALAGLGKFGAISVRRVDVAQAKEIYDDLRANVRNPDGSPAIGGHTTANGTMVILVPDEVADGLGARIADHLGDAHDVAVGEVYAAFIEQGDDNYGFSGKTTDRESSTGASFLGYLDKLRQEARDAVSAAAKDRFSATRRTKPGEGEEVARAFISLSQLDDVFQTPKSESKDLATIVQEALPEASFREVNYSNDKSLKQYRISIGGADAIVERRGDYVWLNVAAQGEGKGGSRIYSAVGNWAANNGLAFIGDPAGLSETGIRRRLENVISLRLKYPLADIRLHPSQLNWLADKFGVSLELREGDQLHNLGEMLRASYEVNTQLHPELKNVEYRNGGFLDRRTSEPFDFQGLARESRGFGAAGSLGAPGYATLRRAALSKSLVEGEAVPGGSDLTEDLYALRDQSLPTPAGLRGILYSGGRLPATIEIDGVERPTTNANGQQIHPTETGVRNFWKWFGGSKVVDEEGRPVVVYHGTTRDFSVFDSQYANVESDLGGGFYFSSTQGDVAENYAGFGQDLTNRIEQTAERLVSASQEELPMEDALRMAREKLSTHEGATVPAYLRMENPVLLGGDTETFLTYEEEYDAETDEYQEPVGTLVDFIEAFRYELLGGGLHWQDVETVLGSIFEEDVSDNGGISVSDLIRKVKSSEGLYDALDEEGNLLSSELLRRAFQEIGYDGFSDSTVFEKFGYRRRELPRGEAFTGGMQGLEPETTHYVVFTPDQIKSATGNLGAFDPTNLDITRSAPRFPGEPTASFQPKRPQSKWEKLWTDGIYKFLDKHTDLANVVKSIGNVADKWNAYLQETLFHGRAAKMTADFLNKELNPLLKAMQAEGVSLEEFEEFLWNRHAEERNDQINEVNPEFGGDGSGISTAEARAYLRGLPEAKRLTLAKLAGKVDAINAETRKLLVDYGLEKQSTVSAWEKAYSHYVPLHRGDLDFFEAHLGTGTGSGFNVKGSPFKRALGSRKPVVDILGNIALQRERTITRGEKNTVATALYGLALQNPSPEFWAPIRPGDTPEKVANNLVAMGINPIDARNAALQPLERYVDPRTGLVAERTNPTYLNSANVIAARVDGENRYVVLNANDEIAGRMAMALKNLDTGDMGPFWQLLHKGTRWFAAINTQYNPIFGFVNLTRDLQTAALNLSSTPLAGRQKTVLRKAGPALRGIYADLRRSRKGEEPATGENARWADLWEEFQTEGGQTGYRDMFASPEDRTKDIQSQLAKLKEGPLRRTARYAFDWLSDFNETMENSVRLAAYDEALAAGLSKEKAADLAKNLTVNFNRKGQISSQAGALYAFFNASAQGSARLAETLAGPAGRKILAGGLLLGIMQPLVLALAGYADDDIPEFVKERNLIIPVPGTKKYAQIPMPLGYHVLPNLGRYLSEALMGARDEAPVQTFGKMLALFVNAFNPIGSAGMSAQTLTPTVLDPLVALGENRDWTGKPIAQEDFSSLRPTPGHTRAKDTASTWAKFLSEGLNWLSGGTKYKPGSFSPTPDQLDYLLGQFFGGVARELSKIDQSAGALVTGEDLPMHKIPLLGRYAGEVGSKSAEGGKYYANITRINEHDLELKGRRANREPVKDYLAENPEARLIDAAKTAQTRIANLKDRKEALIARGAKRETIRLTEDQITAVMKRFNEQVGVLRK